MRWVVVGAGTAGCIVASRLAEARHDVILVEEGPDLTGATAPYGVTSVDYVDALSAGERLAGVPVRRVVGGPPIAYPAGRGVGGSAAINGLLLDAGGAEQYRTWGWADWGKSASRVAIRGEQASEEMLGPIDRALLRAAPGARRAVLAIAGGRRREPAGAYLDPVRALGRMSVVASRRVDRIELEHRAAVGVALAGGEVITGDAVAVCAGALGTPALLLRSGIHDLPVGEGLQDHPSVSISLRLRRPAARAPVATGAVLTLGDVQVTTMNHTSAGAEYGAINVALLAPRSRGRVGVDRRGAAVVDFDQFVEPDDLDRLVAGVRLAAELLRHDAFTSIVEASYADDRGTPAALSQDDDVASWVSHGGGRSAHAAASCPIGSVLDDDGRVVGYDHLFVVDASAFPQIPAAPTALPTMILAERLSARLAAL